MTLDNATVGLQCANSRHYQADGAHEQSWRQETVPLPQLPNNNPKYIQDPYFLFRYICNRATARALAGGRLPVANPPCLPLTLMPCCP